MARKRVRTGTWIKASAVRLNKDGSVSIVKPKGRVPNVAGYRDAHGFHPIRWDSDYDPSELSKEEPGYATDHTQPRAHRGRGGRMVPGFFVGSRKKRPAAKKRRRPAAKKRRR